MKLYQDLVEILPESNRAYLRVERVGSFYTVRIGKFEDQGAAEEFLLQTGQYLSNAMILQAYIKQERILRVYQPVTEINLALDAEQAAVFAEQESSVSTEMPEPGEIAEVTMEPDMEVPEEATQEPEAIISDAVEPPGEIIEQAPEREEPVIIVSDIEEMAAPQDASSVVTPDDEPIEDESWPAGVEVDVPSIQEEDLSDETDAEQEVVDEAEKSYERLGQPAGLSSVRNVAIFSKDIFGGNYKFPSVIHYDPFMDEIYVIGGGGMHPSTRIMIYGPDYFPVASLGEGRGVVTPRGLALDKEGNIYITQSICSNKNTSCLRVLNPAFFPIAEIAFEDFDEVPEKFSPTSVAVDNRYVYLTAEFSNGVLVLDSDYKFVRWLVPMKVGGIKEQVGDDINHPKAHVSNDVAVDSNGRIYIVCPDVGRIFILDTEWNFLFAFGTKGGSTGKLSRARSIAVDVDREALYVSDYMRHTINVYDYNDGSFLFEIGGQGKNPGWFQFPTHVEVDRRGNLIVADYMNNRVQVLFVP